MPDLNQFYTWAVQACNNPNVGYSQTYRNQRKVDGITYYDCSSFVNYALLAGGWETPGYAPNYNAFTTASEEKVLLSLGWNQVDASGQYLPGDIGLKVGHTEICYQGGTGKGIFMGAHTSNAALQNQVSIGSSSGNPTYQRSFPKIFRWGEQPPLQDGPSIYVVAAMAGNFWQESGINPEVWENLEPPSPDPYDAEVLNKGFGIGQWTNTGGDHHGRLYQMLMWVRDGGQYNDEDGDRQTAYIIVENYWTPRNEYPEFQNLNDFLTSTSTDIERLTHAWNLCWEGIHDSSWDARVDYAKQCYDYIVLHQNDLYNFPDWWKGNQYLPNWKRLDNAVRLFIALNGWWDNGIPTDPKHKLPVFDMLRNPSLRR